MGRPVSSKKNTTNFCHLLKYWTTFKKIHFFYTSEKGLHPKRKLDNRFLFNNKNRQKREIRLAVLLWRLSFEPNEPKEEKNPCLRYYFGFTWTVFICDCKITKWTVYLTMTSYRLSSGWYVMRTTIWLLPTKGQRSYVNLFSPFLFLQQEHWQICSQGTASKGDPSSCIYTQKILFFQVEATQA